MAAAIRITSHPLTNEMERELDQIEEEERRQTPDS